MWRTGMVCDDAALRNAALERIERVLQWQSPEGWWPEYDGADPGYQTATIDCLAKLRREVDVPGLDNALRRAVEFCRPFQHLNGGYGGEYGSRGTRHFYAHGFELLAGEFPAAAELAEHFLHSLADDTAAGWDDDRMYVHRLGNLLEAYLDWSPIVAATNSDRLSPPPEQVFSQAGLFTQRTSERQLIVSTARCGSFFYAHDDRHGSASYNDAGLVVELADGRTAVSQTHDRSRSATFVRDADGSIAEIMVSGDLLFARFERATPFKQASLHFLAGALGSFGRGLLRRLLQRRVITARRSAPVRLTRTLRRRQAGDWEVVDVVELTDARTQVRGMAFASDLQAAYTAATNVFHDGLRQPWFDLAEYVVELNRRRRRGNRPLAGRIGLAQTGSVFRGNGHVKKRLIFFAKIAITVLLCVMLVRAADWRAVVRQMAEVNLSMLAVAVLLFIPQTLISAWRWRRFVRPVTHISYGEALREILAASALNLVVPAKLGDFSKAAMLPDVPTGKGKEAALRRRGKTQRRVHAARLHRLRSDRCSQRRDQLRRCRRRGSVDRRFSLRPRTTLRPFDGAAVCDGHRRTMAISVRSVAPVSFVLRRRLDLAANFAARTVGDFCRFGACGILRHRYARRCVDLPVLRHRRLVANGGRRNAHGLALSRAGRYRDTDSLGTASATCASDRDCDDG
ncbi:MAG: lysylphosphatidylglycerol synthase domain-containing protein [Pirellulales bacterium]